jgi:eukaryotic-like serine/threonine-protein kinase
LNLQGSLIAGKYRLVSLLGEGGMGSVWRAEHLGLNAPVAVKLLNQVVAASSDGLGRFHREAQAAAALRSPHVVQIFDHGVDPVSQQPFIVMELMEGESLASRLAREGRLSPEQTARVITHISRALARAHEAGIVHRDLKPDNVFLVQNEDEEIAKVLDFGIAKTQANQLGPGSATRTGAVMGTPYYMSPEQISGSKSVDFRTDLWALTIIAFECLSGRRPFEADTIGGLALKICAEPMPRPSALGPVPPGFDAWFERAAARDASARFGSAREMAEEFRRLCGRADGAVPIPSATHSVAATPALAASTGPLIRTANGGESSEPKRTQGHRKWLLAGGASLVLALAGAWFVVRGAGDGDKAAAPPATQVSTSVAPAAVTAVVVEPSVDPAPAPTAEPPATVAPATSASAVPQSGAKAPARVTAVRPPAPTRVASRPAPSSSPPPPAAEPVRPVPAAASAPTRKPAGLGSVISDRR